ncbi:DPEP2 neighbor protein-like [Molossus nigricans]
MESASENTSPAGISQEGNQGMASFSKGLRIKALAPTFPPTPGHYHVPYRSCGEPQVGWHGETYCLVGGYRSYGDAPLATLAQVEAEKPDPRQALKRHHPVEKSNKDLGCSSPKIRRLEHGGKRLTPQKLAG